MYHINPSSPSHFAHSHSHLHSHPQPFPRPSLPSSQPPASAAPSTSTSSSSVTNPTTNATLTSSLGQTGHTTEKLGSAYSSAPAFHVPVLSQRAPPPPASLLRLSPPSSTSSSAPSPFSSHAHTLPPPPPPTHNHNATTSTSSTTTATGAASYAMPGPPPSPGLGSGDPSWLTGGHDLFAGFLADDPAPGESLLTETEQKYFDMFLDWMATGTEPSHDAVEGMAAAANAAAVSASRHPSPDTSLPSPAATTQGSTKSGTNGTQVLYEPMAFASPRLDDMHHQQAHLPPLLHASSSSSSSSFSSRRHAPPPIHVQSKSKSQSHFGSARDLASGPRSASHSHTTPLMGPILSPTSTYQPSSEHTLVSPSMSTSPTSYYPTPLSQPHPYHQLPPSTSTNDSSQPAAGPGAVQQLYALTPAGMVPVHVPAAALTAALEAQGMQSGSVATHHHPPPAVALVPPHPPSASSATTTPHHVMYHSTQQQPQGGQGPFILASPPPTAPGSGFVQPGATLLAPPPPPGSHQPNGQPVLVQLVPLASPSPSNPGALGLPSPTYQMYTVPPSTASVMGATNAADAYATPGPSTPFGSAPSHPAPLTHFGRARTLSTVSAMALDMGHLGLATPTAPSHPPGAFLDSPFFLHSAAAAQQHPTVHAPSTTLSVVPPPRAVAAADASDVVMDDAAPDFAIPLHAPSLQSPAAEATPGSPTEGTGKPGSKKRPSTSGASSRKRARPSPADESDPSSVPPATAGKVTKRKPAAAKAKPAGDAATAKAAKASKAKAKAAAKPGALEGDATAVPVNNSHSEKRRRTLIRLGFQQLVDLVPELRETARVMAKPEPAPAAVAEDVPAGTVVGGHTVSKATILTKSFEFMRTVQRKIAKYEALVADLEAHAARLGVVLPPPPGEHEDADMDLDAPPPFTPAGQALGSDVAHVVQAIGSS